MMLIMRRFVLFVFLLITLDSAGQLAPVSDQYIFNPILINPAHAGMRGALNVSALYRRQWVGIEGAPETIMLTSDTPVSDGTMGVGFSIINDKTGVTKETSFGATYSYKIETGGGNLSFGLKAGLITTNTKWSDLVILDPGDEFFLVDSKVFVVPDFAFGSYLSNEKYFAGFSIPRLLSYKFDFEKNRYAMRVRPGQYQYLFQGGYLFDIAPDIRFLPSTLITLSPGQKMMVDFNFHFIFSDKLWAGISYRTNKSVAGMLQFAINNQLKAAYSYYLDFSRLGSLSKGTHEIMLRYEFRFKADVVNPLIF